MATSRQSQHAPTSKPRTYITTNLSQPPLARQPNPTPHPTPNPDAPINRDRDANGNPGWWSRMTFDAPRTRVQPKLTVGAPNDQYEQEADRVADQVMSMPDAATQQSVQREEMPEEELQTKSLSAFITPLVQREAMPEAALQTKASGNADIQRMDNLEEEDLQMKPLENSLIQREDNLEEEEIQTKPDLQRATDGSLQAGGAIESQLNSSQGSGSPLPDDVRSFMEPRFGADFSQVRVHTGSEAVQMNRDLNAQAFTHKQDVYFGAGKAPGKDALTAHELTHVVQQSDTISRAPKGKPKAKQPLIKIDLTQPSGSGQAAMNIALGEQGVKENPTGSNRGTSRSGSSQGYVDAYTGGKAQPWCAHFVSWCFEQAGSSPFGHVAAVSGLRSWAKSQGCYMPSAYVNNANFMPMPGDIFTMPRSGGTGHTGFVVRYDSASGTMETIEGNKSDAVSFEARSVSDVDGFIRVQP